jgi:predicted ATP-grasp superfamily ATP-dependent carboligase
MMEINGRLWGSLQLAIDAGVDFPRLLVEAGLGVRSAPVTSYRIGARSQWEWGDVDNLLALVFHSSEKLALPTARPSRFGTIARFVRTLAWGAHKEVLRLDDPMPFFRESMNWIRRR